MHQDDTLSDKDGTENIFLQRVPAVEKMERLNGGNLRRTWTILSNIWAKGR